MQFLKFSKILIMAFFLCGSEGQSKESSWSISAQVFEAQYKVFLSHQGSGPFDNYLSMEIDYAPVAELFKQLENSLQTKLKNRGEAHITVITPVEYTQALKGKVTMQEIDKIALELKIQESNFKILCLGRGQLDSQTQKLATYFLVVESDDLLKIRVAVEQLYLSRGGSPERFKAANFYPHITLGFTQRDLHLEDGVVKDKSSCLGELKIIN